MFKVWHKATRFHRFETLEAAKGYAQTVFARTGKILAITKG